jgi:hypothetical protein
MAAIQPKSILKKPNYPATAGSSSKSREELNRELALYHANLIQQRKEIELQNLLNIEILMEYPLHPEGHDATNPSPEDARSFKELIRWFQPSDYDDLITERNCCEHCGFVLCQNDRVKQKGGGTYRLVGKNGKGKDFKVVKKEELEKWCSDACAKRALYVRVQLSETPAWEREWSGSEEIQLLDEPKSEEEQVVRGIENMKLDAPETSGKEQDSADLALERGDRGFAAKKGMLDVSIKEREVTAPPQAPSLETDNLSERLDTMHLALEGHTSVFGSERHRRHQLDESTDNEVDTDWGI